MTHLNARRIVIGLVAIIVFIVVASFAGCSSSKKLKKDSQSISVHKSDSAATTSVHQADTSSLSITRRDTSSRQQLQVEQRSTGTATYVRETTVHEDIDTAGRTRARTTTIRESGQRQHEATTRSKSQSEQSGAGVAVTASAGAHRDSSDQHHAATADSSVTQSHMDLDKHSKPSLPFGYWVLGFCLLLLHLFLIYRYIRKRFPNLKLPL